MMRTQQPIKRIRFLQLHVQGFFENCESINTVAQEIGYHSEVQTTVVEEIENLKDLSVLGLCAIFIPTYLDKYESF